MDVKISETELSRIGYGEITLDDVAAILSLTIKHDDSNKKIVFLCMLSAYTEDSQINVTLNAPSSTGKTYLVNQIANLFPSIDKIERSGASPTSFFYGEGEIDEVRKAKIVSLERKITIFSEAPNPLLQEKLRAVLSHDKKELVYSFTNKNKGKNVTETIIIRGYCATIFCSAALRLDEQETTRAILLSPESTIEKIENAISLQAERSSDPSLFESNYDNHPTRRALMERINAIREENVGKILVPEYQKIRTNFIKYVGPLRPRHSRDMQHLMELIKAVALLNAMHRRDKYNNVVATDEDIRVAFGLWKDVYESQQLNVPPAVLEFYKKFIVPTFLDKFAKAKSKDKDLWESMKQDKIGVSPHELSKYYMETVGSAIPGENLRKQYLPQLANAGLIAWERPQGQDVDARTKHIFPQRLTDKDKKYIGTYVGENMRLDHDW